MKMPITYIICEYADYQNLPAKLSCCHTEGAERKSLDETKFVTWCGMMMQCEDDCVCMTWRNNTEPEFTHAEILEELKGPEWFDLEAMFNT